ncbi:DUF2490 domain-containing protein [Sphingomonas glaciei]|uniref:DUF2490 domain-containing protein n=1 Tax=Sphingomonas glaciei TaxID=2938948 RepID=A0ABY5MYS7_9SPHN|nr:DUF2490 domain-containing protein [Sphingomonas glaciei]UUR07501.1 DUF2490 domain-containing protein [Sphingomonas glaciei]
MIHRLLGAALAVGLSSPALAEENRLEAWFDATVAMDLGGDSFAEFQTQQRARGNSNPTGDNQTYRLWLGHKFGGIKASAGIHRSKEGLQKETRLMQQASYNFGSTGIKGRTRLEQRFIDYAAQTGWRVRQRVGYAIPLSSEKGGWKLAANAEGFWTLRASSRTGDTGLTGLRSFAGFERSLGKLDLSLGYTRQQSIRKNRPDLVGHAPTLSINLNL